MIMIIAGLQKTTLIDYPGKIGCTIFLHGCNFRCLFCYNPELVVRKASRGLSEELFFDFLDQRKNKLEAVCITGGEPLLSLKKDFVRKIKEKGFLVKIDTNGIFPERLKEFLDEGLVDYVAMDIKASPKKYKEVVNIPVDLKKIEESIRLIHAFGSYEFRTTVLYSYHDAFELRMMGRWLTSLLGAKPKKFFLQGYKSGHEMISTLEHEKSVTEKDIRVLAECVTEFFDKVEVRV